MVLSLATRVGVRQTGTWYSEVLCSHPLILGAPFSLPFAPTRWKFEDNDASHSSANAFEATFSNGNIFRRNRASYSSYGFWLVLRADALGCLMFNHR